MKERKNRGGKKVSPISIAFPIENWFAFIDTSSIASSQMAFWGLFMLCCSPSGFDQVVSSFYWFLPQRCSFRAFRGIELVEHCFEMFSTSFFQWPEVKCCSRLSDTLISISRYSTYIYIYINIYIQFERISRADISMNFNLIRDISFRFATLFFNPIIICNSFPLDQEVSRTLL